MLRYRPIFVTTLIATLVHVLAAGCAKPPVIVPVDPVPAVHAAAESAAKVDGQLAVISDLAETAKTYATQTGEFIQAAIGTIPADVAGTFVNTITALHQAEAADAKTIATIASLQDVVTSTRGEVDHLAGLLVKANGEIRQLQRDHASDRQKFDAALQTKQDRIDEIESSIGYQAEVWVKAIWFWTCVGIAGAVLIGLLGGPIGAMIGGPIGGGLSWLSTVVMHVGTLGATKILEVILSWRSAAKAAT